VITKFGSLIWGLEQTIKNPMRTAPDMVVASPDLIRMAIGEIERLRGIIRSCQHGMEVTDIGDGELIGLYRPNKEKSHD